MTEVKDDQHQPSELPDGEMDVDSSIKFRRLMIKLKIGAFVTPILIGTEVYEYLTEDNDVIHRSVQLATYIAIVYMGKLSLFDYRKQRKVQRLTAQQNRL